MSNDRQRTNPWRPILTRGLLSRRAFAGGAAAFGAWSVSAGTSAQDQQPPVIEPIEPDEPQEPVPSEPIGEPATFEPEETQTGEIEEVAEEGAGEYFAETGHNLSEPFLTPWREAGGVEALGMPLSEGRFVSDTGMIEQVFEGIVLVQDPTAEAGQAVRGRRLGDRRVRATAPAAARQAVSGCGRGASNCQFFPETGHTISGDIARFWTTSGEAPIFGLPRSEEFAVRGGSRQAFENVILNASSSGEVTAQFIGRDVVADAGLANDPAFLPAPPSLGTSTLVTASDGLRLRSGPSLDAEIIVVLPDNAEFIAVTGVSGEWIPGYADGYSGYVASEYLQEPEPLPTVAMGGEWDTSVWQGAALAQTNIRARPDTNSRVIETLQYGDPVIAVDWVKGEEVADDGAWTWAQLEDGTYLYERYVGRAGPVEAPPVPNDAPSQGKWIDCNLTQQLLVAYEGQTPVRVAVQTTGKPGWETPAGYFHINTRVANETMESGSIGAAEFYKLENVLFTQYFTDRGHALHFAWWKTPETIGRPGSHGCLNLLLDDAEYFWNWADVGTPVYSHY